MKKNILFPLSLCFIFSMHGRAQTISTIAGDGSTAYAGDGGSATAASFGAKDVKLDSSGNIYIVDQTNNCIRKVNTAGIISTVAGNGTSGYSGDGGPATAAQLSSPNAMAVDRYGNLYIADGPNDCIRMVSTSGIITTVAGGSGGYFGDGGPATAAGMDDPYGVAVDTAGNIYIGGSYDNVIRMVNTAGIISTIAGNGTPGFSGDGGPATAAELAWPTGVFADNLGNVFIADWCNNRIRMVNASGIITTVAGSGTVGTTPGVTTGSYSGDGGAATAATLNSPPCVTRDKYGNIYIPDAFNNRVRVVNNLGIISTIAGNGTAGFSGDGGPAMAAEMNIPDGIALDDTGNVLFVDGVNARVRKIQLGVVIDTSTSIKSIPGYANNGITIFPNPNSGTFIITETFTNSSTSKDASIEIVDIIGNVIYNDVASIKNGCINKEIILKNNIARGVYLIKVNNGNSNNVTRFVLNK